jgi:hypothetical protein
MGTDRGSTAAASASTTSPPVDHESTTWKGSLFHERAVAVPRPASSSGHAAHAVSRADAGDGRFLQVSGRFTITRRASSHRRPGRVEVGEPLDVNATYSMTTIDYTRTAPTTATRFFARHAPAQVNTEREADIGPRSKYIRGKGRWRSGGRIVKKVSPGRPLLPPLPTTMKPTVGGDLKRCPLEKSHRRYLCRRPISWSRP